VRREEAAAVREEVVCGRWSHALRLQQTWDNLAFCSGVQVAAAELWGRGLAAFTALNPFRVQLKYSLLYIRLRIKQARHSQAVSEGTLAIFTNSYLTYIATRSNRVSPLKSVSIIAQFPSETPAPAHRRTLPFLEKKRRNPACSLTALCASLGSRSLGRECVDSLGPEFSR
jgi:hypothetical protein